MTHEATVDPLPFDPDHPDFAPFWSGCAEGRLLVPACGNGHRFWPPRPTCPECHTGTSEWVESVGRGALYSWTVVRRTRRPEFRERVPYVVGMISVVDLPGVRMVGRCEVPPEAPRDGLELDVQFEDPRHGVRLPFWRSAP